MIPSSWKLPPAPPRELFPADVYAVEVVELDIVENKYFDPSEPSSSPEQVQIKLGFVEPGPFLGKTFTIWASPKVSGGGKQSKLYQILCAALGGPLSKEQMANQQELIGPDFLNSIVGAQFRVTLEKKKSKTGESDINAAAGFLPKKESYPPFVAK